MNGGWRCIICIKEMTGGMPIPLWVHVQPPVHATVHLMDLATTAEQK